MDPTLDLPDGACPTLALVHPTEEEKLIQFKLNGVEWRGALSLPAYLRREEVLSKQSLTRDGGITYWILVDTAAKENPLDPSSSARLPLASCETYRKKALVWQDGKVHETISHGIGSVFCAPHLRKRGYAARLMQELGKLLRTHHTSKQTESWFSVLFSDIGKKFYAEHGWEPFNSAHVCIPAGVSESLDANSLPTVRPLRKEHLAELCKIDEALVRKTLESRAKNSNTAVALIPDIETIRWHHAREDFVGTELHGKTPDIKGAMVGSEKGKRIWCYWTRMWYNSNPAEAKGNTLHILRLVIEDEGRNDWERSGRSHMNGAAPDHNHDAAIASLLLMAQREAQEWNMEEIEAWNPSSAMMAAAQKLDPNAKVVNRDMESITSLKWFPSHDGPVADSIDWIGNEKYCWC
ncbi:uncharacterized protein BDR25DRAFT_333511 [Lindgomyces ingoldianus]|uniref:Uncharacterized protein n=1 Tax=Lindgomyces ingoldianus TaxID=673940 RepID=A0ACB6QYK3_9PLEO|nr:uncharacterized protein BDR25DRAFT_333511 [Lindgomyces ingoldianus]KAF2472064.1 hypothetical protein BDR25DRAFT_333511 [Lindgomyces ingoldianus]